MVGLTINSVKKKKILSYISQSAAFKHLYGIASTNCFTMHLLHLHYLREYRNCFEKYWLLTHFFCTWCSSKNRYLTNEINIEI